MHDWFENRAQNCGRDFFALRDVNFDVRKGESVGIIGRNGAGKSTLLQMIAGTLQPTTGSVSVTGRVGALLELGSGFNPEFTGAENVRLNATILGLTKREIDERFDSIAAFADIGDFLHQRVKTYSSGMQVRLAFAVMAHLDAELLIVDEALSVGDVFFGAKCARFLHEYRARGGTLLFVSHDLFLVERLCARTLLLDQGVMRYFGDTATAIGLYYQKERGAPATSSTSRSAAAQAISTIKAGGREAPDAAEVELQRQAVTTDGRACIRRLFIRGTDGRPTTQFEVGDWCWLEMEVEFKAEMKEVQWGFALCDRAGTMLGGVHSHFTKPPSPIPLVRPGEIWRCRTRLRMNLPAGEYLLFLGIALNLTVTVWEDLYVVPGAARLVVSGAPRFWGQVPFEATDTEAAAVEVEVAG